MSGDRDELSSPKDVAWTANQLKNTLVFNREYKADHSAFSIGKDMSFFTKDAMAIFNYYNGICDPDTKNSNFEKGN